MSCNCRFGTDKVDGSQLLQ